MVRYILKLTKGEDIRFISHLDYLKAVQRIIKRSSIPVQYSKGFNPHMECSFAGALSVGVYSQSEYMDIYLQEEMDKRLILSKLNKSSDKNIEFLNVKLIGQRKIRKVMAMVEACLYTIDLKSNDAGLTFSEFKHLLDEDEWIFLKKSKKSEILMNLKEGVVELNYLIENEYLKIVAMLKNGSVFNISPKMIVSFLKDKLVHLDKESFPNIERIEMYYNYNGSYIPISMV